MPPGCSSPDRTSRLELELSGGQLLAASPCSGTMGRMSETRPAPSDPLELVARLRELVDDPDPDAVTTALDMVMASWFLLMGNDELTDLVTDLTAEVLTAHGISEVEFVDVAEDAESEAELPDTSDAIVVTSFAPHLLGPSSWN